VKPGCTLRELIEHRKATGRLSIRPFTSLFGFSERTSTRAGSAVQAFHEASSNVDTAAYAADELSRSIGEISRQLSQTGGIVGQAAQKRARRIRRSRRLPTARRRSATS
jgi:hypothetical protein